MNKKGKKAYLIESEGSSDVRPEDSVPREPERPEGSVPRGSERPKQRQRVFVAMSGGVDSSVAAALLKEQGYDVTGVFINAWEPDFIECTRGDDRLEAMRAAAHLGIPFLTFDFEKEYKKEVVDYMVAEYKAGRTPNPDVMCNARIKFGSFLKRAKELGADYISTGHYVRLMREIPNPKSQIPNKSQIQNSPDLLLANQGSSIFINKNRDKFQTIKLLTGVDTNKDQSYFLWTLTQQQLQYVLFPIGDYTKPEVRGMARKFGLSNAERKESQGLCFVGEFKMREFLEHFIPPKRGDVFNEKGEVIGLHEGAFYFTCGQRHGFTVTKKLPDSPPLYVISKNIDKNTITVSPGTGESKETTKEIVLENVNFISGETPDFSKTYMARHRYRQLLEEVKINQISDSRLKIQFNKNPQSAVAEGQSIVLYSGEECIGGGVIV